MFKSEEQIKTFIDSLENFINSTIRYNVDRNAEDAFVLNRGREAFEEKLKAISGLTPAANSTDTYSCPDCGHDMALRTNRQNGNKFWGCKKYPQCKGTRDENGLSKEEREEAKYRKDKEEEARQQDGFSFNREKRNPVTEVAPPSNTGWVNPFTQK